MYGAKWIAIDRGSLEPEPFAPEPPRFLFRGFPLAERLSAREFADLMLFRAHLPQLRAMHA